MCQFSGAFCNSLHCDEMGYLCRVPYWKRPVERKIPELSVKGTVPGEIMVEEGEDLCDESGYLCGESGCGLCALKQLVQCGITHLKLVGRGNYADFLWNATSGICAGHSIFLIRPKVMQNIEGR